MIKKRIAVAVLIVLMLGLLGGCSKSDDVNDADQVDQSNNIATQYERFVVKSDNLNDGKWDDIVSNTDKGSNLSPQLSWEPVEGAQLYVIYMVDVNMQYFMHWKADGVTETELTTGWAQSDYIGPYPPEGGTHIYDVYVFALKKPVDRVKGSVNGQNPKFPNFIEALDTDAEGNTGNIVACGYQTGTFTN